MAKTQIYAKSVKARRMLAADPIFADFTKDHLTALGVCFCPGNSKPSEKQLARFESAEVTALRARCAPVVAYLRQFMVTTAATTKAVFGWLIREPPRYLIAPLETKLRKVGFTHVVGSVHMIKLIFGHGLDVSFMAGQAAVTAIHRFCKVSHRNLRDWNQKGGLSGRVRRFLQNLGFHENGQYKWQHGSLPLSIDLTFQGVVACDSNDLCHRLREAWRWHMWDLMKKSGRRDTMQVSRLSYDPHRLQVIKGICKAPPTAHLPAIACGAFVSPLRYSKITGVGSGLCPFCKDEIGSTQHVFWECRVTNVAQLRPHDELEAVFGWPVSKDDDRCLKHMAAVRCQVLTLRYPGGGGALSGRGRRSNLLMAARGGCPLQFGFWSVGAGRILVNNLWQRMF